MPSKDHGRLSHRCFLTKTWRISHLTC
jgi:hypothetical protein